MKIVGWATCILFGLIVLGAMLPQPPRAPVDNVICRLPYESRKLAISFAWDKKTKEWYYRLDPSGRVHYWRTVSGRVGCTV